MEINLEEMTIMLGKTAEDIYGLAKTLSSKNVMQVVEVLNESNQGLPRILRTRALKMVLNDFVKIAKDLPITTELLHRLNWYMEYSDYQLNKFFFTLANSGDTRFHENACTEKYKISLWILVLVNAEKLNITEKTINKLTKLDDSFVKFAEFNEILNGCLYDFENSIDVIPSSDYSRVMFKSSTVVELREVAVKYDINVPKRLNRAQLLEVIIQRLQEEDKFDDGVHAKIKDMKVVSLQRFAKDNDIKASTELRKDAVIDFILKAVENNQTSLRTLPFVELIVLEEETFEMKPEYIRDIDSRYFYEFDEDGEIVSMSDIEDLKAKIDQLKNEQEAEKERLDQLKSESETIQEDAVIDEYEQRVKELEKQIEILNENQNRSEDGLTSEDLEAQEERLKRMMDERIKEMMENQAIQEEMVEQTIVEEVVEEFSNEDSATAEELAAREAEKEAELAAMEAEKAAELAAREAEKEAELAAMEAEKEAELAAMEAEKEAELAAMEAEKEAELAAMEAEKEAELAAMEAEKAAELAAMEAEKEAELAAMEAAKEAELIAKENELAASAAEKAAELAAKEAELAAREAEMRREADLAREAEYAAREAELAAREAEIQREAELAAKESELAAKEAEIQREAEYAAKEAELAAREAEIQREAELAYKVAELAAKEAELAAREANSEQYNNYEEQQYVEKEVVVVEEHIYDQDYEENPMNEQSIYDQQMYYDDPYGNSQYQSNEQSIYNQEVQLNEEGTYQDYNQNQMYYDDVESQQINQSQDGNFNDDPYLDLAPVESYSIPVGVIDEVSFISYEELEQFNKPASVLYSEPNYEQTPYAQPVYAQPQQPVYQEQPIYAQPQQTVYQEQQTYAQPQQITSDENLNNGYAQQVYQEHPIHSQQEYIQEAVQEEVNEEPVYVDYQAPSIEEETDEQKIIDEQRRIIKSQREMLDDKYIKTKDDTELNQLGLTEEEKEQAQKDLQQQMMQQHQEYLEQLRELEKKQDELDRRQEELNEKLAMASITNSATKSYESDGELDSRKARFNLIEKKINSLSSVEEESPVETTSELTPEHLNSLFESNENNDNVSADKVVLEDENNKIVEDQPQMISTSIDDSNSGFTTPVEDKGYVNLTDRQLRAKEEIQKLLKKKAKIEKYKTMKDQKLVKQYNRTKRNKFIRNLILLLLVVALYLFVVLAGLYASDNSKVLWIWEIEPESAFGKAHITVLNTISGNRYPTISNVIGKIYTPLYDLISKFTK